MWSVRYTASLPREGEKQEGGRGEGGGVESNLRLGDSLGRPLLAVSG